jgi:hypothetical protein
MALMFDLGHVARLRQWSIGREWVDSSMLEFGEYLEAICEYQDARDANQLALLTRLGDQLDKLTHERNQLTHECNLLTQQLAQCYIDLAGAEEKIK